MMKMSGFKAWKYQRYSAILLAFTVPTILFTVISVDLSSRADFLQLLQTPWFFVVVFISLMTLYVHLWVGLRDVVLDYLMGSVQLMCLYLVRALIVFLYLWTLFIIYLVVAN